MPRKMEKIEVIELFAGVGGFRLGLEGWKGKSALSGYKKDLQTKFEVIWGNQWEPNSKSQDAFQVYANRFAGQHSNEDIQKVIDTNDIPHADLLVGGFPCQDYSVARTLNQAEGIQGKKGVLWWSIYSILQKKIENKKPIKYLMLENVDRLLKSPATQRGRDFAIMLSSLNSLGYAVEWRVINAADYGMPQRRRRVFFVAYYQGTSTYKKIEKLKDKNAWLLEDGVFASAFPVAPKSGIRELISSFCIDDDPAAITKSFNKNGKKSPFTNSGLMINNEVFAIETKPKYSGKGIILKDVIVKNESLVASEYFVNGSLVKWKELKGAKKITRFSKEGFEYEYAEGSMTFPDDINKPSRTIVTGEGGNTPSRFKHVIESPESGALRRLIPLELERLNMFPDDHTKVGKISDIKRAFFMGNALVVGIVEKLGLALQVEVLNQ